MSGDYRLRVGSGRGTTRAEDAQGIPTQSHISPSILVYEEDGEARGGNLDGNRSDGTIPDVGIWALRARQGARL